jgi:hypothetical protein
MHMAGMAWFGPARLHARGEGARAVVQVPVEALGQTRPCAALSPRRMHVGDEHQQHRELGATPRDAELGRLLDAVDGVVPALARPMTFARLAWACSRKEEKSVVAGKG